MRFGQTLSTEPYHAGWGNVAKTQQFSLLLGNTPGGNALVVTITQAFGPLRLKKQSNETEILHHFSACI